MKFNTKKRKFSIRWRKQWVWGKSNDFRFLGPIVVEVRKHG